MSDKIKARSGDQGSIQVGAVLLAAGAGSRLGRRPKPLLELDGVSLIRRQLIALSGAGVGEVVVVTGHHGDLIEAGVHDHRATLVRNPAPDDGPTSSLRIGLAALSASLDAVLIALADQPLVTASDIRALIAAFVERDGASMVAPRFEGTPGNPVIIEGSLRDEWLAGDVDDVGRRWRDANPERLRWIDVDNARCVIDIDTEDDLRRFAERAGRRLRWPRALMAAGICHLDLGQEESLS